MLFDASGIAETNMEYSDQISGIFFNVKLRNINVELKRDENTKYK